MKSFSCYTISQVTQKQKFRFLPKPVGVARMLTESTKVLMMLRKICESQSSRGCIQAVTPGWNPRSVSAVKRYINESGKHPSWSPLFESYSALSSSELVLCDVGFEWVRKQIKTVF